MTKVPLSSETEVLAPKDQLDVTTYLQLYFIMPVISNMWS